MVWSLRLDRSAKVPVWHMKGDPKVLSKILKVCDTSRRGKDEDGQWCATLTATSKSCDDLEWVMMKYRPEISREDLNFISDSIAADKARREAYNDVLSYAKERPPNLELGMYITLYPTQREVVNIAEKMKRLLIADPMGAGKTAMGTGIAALPGGLPCLIVAPVHLMHQWADKLEEYCPWASTVRLNGTKPYEISEKYDFYITAYTRIQGWLSWLLDIGFNTIVFDEVHSIRREDTKKNTAARLLSAACTGNVVGLSGSPIFNYADDIYNIIDVINPGSLGTWEDFSAEWCRGGYGRLAKTIADPNKLGAFLRAEGLMIRRTYEELGMTAGKPNINLVTIDASIEELQKIEAQAIKLAQRTLTASFEEAGMAAREFNTRLRHATGCAKIVAASEFISAMLESGEAEKVVVVAHHHDVYDGLKQRLAAYGVVEYTGRVSPLAKREAIRLFQYSHTTKVFLMSVLAGEGLDGLQQVCNNMVIVEPDWSPSRHAQVIGRLDRPGQTKPVFVDFLMIDDGSDPPIMNILGMKRAMRDGVMDLVAPDEKDLADVPVGKIAQMAAAYLENKKKNVFEGSAATPTKLGSKIATLLTSQTFPPGLPEKALGDLVEKALYGMDYVREYKIDDKNRIDFKVGTVGIELKIGGDRSEVYRQLLRYSEHFTELVLVCPWPLSNMAVGNSYCHVVCYTKQSENLT